MRFAELAIGGAFVIELDPHRDERGFFARTFCKETFRGMGLVDEYPQCNLSFNVRRGTLRGMHYQVEPHPETKIVRCLRGAIFDVIVDLRPHSQTFCGHAAVELTQDNRRALYIPAGLAHGFQCLSDDAEVFYQMSDSYYPELARGVRWDDPAFAIDWPIRPPILSQRDASFADVQR